MIMHKLKDSSSNQSHIHHSWHALITCFSCITCITLNHLACLNNNHMQMGKIAKYSLCYQCLHLNIQHASIISMHVTHGVHFSYLRSKHRLPINEPQARSQFQASSDNLVTTTNGDPMSSSSKTNPGTKT